MWGAGGVVPFLIQWLTFSQLGNNNNDYQYYPSTSISPSQPSSGGYDESLAYSYSGSAAYDHVNSNINRANYYPYPANSYHSNHNVLPSSQYSVQQQQQQQQYNTVSSSRKTRWSLLSDLDKFPEDDLETFLPQLCNILIERDDGNSHTSDDNLYVQFEKILLDKCAASLPFGIRMCAFLKALTQNPYDSSSGSSVGGSIRSSPYSNEYRSDRLRVMQEHFESITSSGKNLPSKVRYLRSIYFRDLSFMLDLLARVGKELRAYPKNHRNHHLKMAMSEFNNLLYSRMVSKGISGTLDQPNHSHIPMHHIASLCPTIASFSLHLPLQHSKEKTLRILRFVEAECEVLPSKDRCPYLVVVELLEQPFECASDELFTQGHGEVDNKMLIEGGIGDGGMTESNDNISGNKDTDGCDGSMENVALFARPNEHNGEEMEVRDTFSDLRGGQVNSNDNYQQPHNSHHAHSDTYSQQPTQPVQQHYPNQQATPYYEPNYPQRQHHYNYQPQSAVMNQRNSQRKTFIQTRTWEEKQEFIRRSSAFGHLPGWKLRSFIVKAGDDLRKEILAMQVIEYCGQIFKNEGIDIHLRPYQIVSTGYMAGLVEFIEGAKSVDRIKKCSPDMPSLKDYYEYKFGPSYSINYAKAAQQFVKSLVGYSLITYLLQVRDRHNANIMIDEDGSVIHIDFGFILGESPGFNMNWENAPFKLTSEYMEIMGGPDSDMFKMFKDLFIKGYFALKKNTEGLYTLVNLFYMDDKRKRGVAKQLQSRLILNTAQEVERLIDESNDNWRTKQYDWFQQTSNNISN